MSAEPANASEPTELPEGVDPGVREFLDSIGRLAKNEGQAVQRAARDTGEFPAELLGLLENLGLLDLGVPVAEGGGDADLQTVALVVERLAEFSPLAAVVVANVHSGRIAARRLPKDQADLGSLPIAVHCGLHNNVSVSVDGSRIRVNGRAERIDGGLTSTSIVVVDQRSGPHLVRPGACRFGPPIAHCGIDGWQVSSLRFDQVSTSSRTLSEEVKPSASYDESLDAKLVLLGAAANGIAAMAWRTAVSYVQSREQFGAAINTFAPIRLLLDEALLAIQGSWRSILAAARGTNMANSAAAAQAAGRVAVQVSDTAIQVHGGYGYLTEFPVAQMLRDGITIQAAIAVNTR